MKILAFIAPALASTFLASCALAAPPNASCSIQRLDGTHISCASAEAFARQTLTAQHVTGAQIVVMDQGRLVWSTAIGLRRKEPPLPMDRETTTWAASITKSVFSTYVMQLVERGEFSLDAPVVQLLPHPLDTYEPYKDKAKDLLADPRWAKVTPRMLLSHSSGLQNFAEIEPDKKMHLHFDPGTNFLYSGEGINLVQFVIEQMKGKPLDHLMQDAIFTPLNMKRTGIIYRSDFADDVADRYDLNEVFRSQTKRYPSRGAGSMTTSAEDLARFLSALFGNKLVKPTTRAEMWKPALQLRSLHEFPLKQSEEQGTEAATVGLAYGVGWGLLTKTPFGPAVFKEGHGDGAQNYVICFERRQTCMILLTNSDNGELAFRPLLEQILGDTVTPWEWEGYTPEYIEASRKQSQ